MRKFNFTIRINRTLIARGTIHIDQLVLSQARSRRIITGNEEAIAAHLAWSIYMGGLRLGDIPGFYGMNESLVTIEAPALVYESSADEIREAQTWTQ